MRAFSQLNPKRQPDMTWKEPTKTDISSAIKLTKSGIAALQPHTERSDAYIHGAAFSAVANAKESLSLLSGIKSVPKPGASRDATIAFNVAIGQAQVGLTNAVDAAAKFGNPIATI